jgi:hypothetical protein
MRPLRASREQPIDLRSATWAFFSPELAEAYSVADRQATGA